MQWYRERRAAAKEAQELRATMANSITAVEVNKSIGMGNIVSQMAVARIASSNKS